jgi:hypothetical protein
MPSLKKALTSAAVGAAVIAGTLAAGATSANAYIVCNRFGECWHVRDRLAYPGAAGVILHDDGWVFDRPGFYHWVHDRPGRGWWEHGHWHRF